MKLKLAILLLFSFLMLSSVYAHECRHGDIPRKPTLKEQKQIDNLLKERLSLSEEQIDILKENRSKHRREMAKIIKKMNDLHIKIRDIYLTGIPKFQADIKTAPMKTQLVILKQNADKLRIQHRKAFEDVLTPEQKVQFDLLKKEKHSNK